GLQFADPMFEAGDSLALAVHFLTPRGPPVERRFDSRRQVINELTTRPEFLGQAAHRPVIIAEAPVPAEDLLPVVQRDVNARVHKQPPCVCSRAVAPTGASTPSLPGKGPASRSV